MRYVALLRGVNLGKRTVKSADLRALLAGLGLDDVATYLASGNAVFSSDDADPAAIGRQIEGALAAEYGFAVPVVIRTTAQLQEVIDACPYRSQADADPTKVHVTFVEPTPPASTWEAVDLSGALPQEMTPGDGVLYLHLPDGMGRAKLPDLVGKALPKATVATTRNWRTVVNLVDL